MSADPSTGSDGTVGPDDAAAAAEAEVAYRRYISERFRVLDLALAGSGSSSAPLNPELDEIIQGVAVPPAALELAAQVEGAAGQNPGARGLGGEPVIRSLRVTDVELFPEPREVDGRDGVSGVATLSACRDTTSVQILDEGGQPIGPPGGALLDDTATISWQVHPVTGDLGWYLADLVQVPVSACPTP